MKKPDDEVAERILQQCKMEGLLSEKSIKKIGLSLSSGELRAEDWSLIMETDLLEEECEGARKS